MHRYVFARPRWSRFVLTVVLCSFFASGAGIIVWDEFWKLASRLLTGATLTSVLQRGESDGSNGSMPPLLLTNGEIHDESNQDKKPAAVPATFVNKKKPPIQSRVTFQEPVNLNAFASASASVTDAGTPIAMESDEQMARRLAEEWGAHDINRAPTPAAAAAARPSSPMETDTTTMSSDEQLARKLQNEMWEEMAAQGISSSSVSAASVNAVSGSPPPPAFEPDLPLKGETIVIDSVDSKMPAKLEFETFGNSFRLFHYNGMRGGSLTPFRVTRLTAEEAVGASVPLTNAGGNKGAATGDLEDVLRTKWPSCDIDWMGASSPSID